MAAQWDKRKNGCLKPSDAAVSSNRPAWRRCELGHSYRATVSSRTQRKTGCPYYAGRKVLKGFNDLKTLCPGVASQWHPSLNGALTPEMVTRGVTPSSTKFAPLPSCDKTNSIKTIKALGSDVLSAALLLPDLDALSALCLVLTRFLSRFRQKAAPLSIAARGGTICSTSQLVAAGKTNDCYIWTLASDFSLCYNAATLIG